MKPKKCRNCYTLLKIFNFTPDLKLKGYKCKRCLRHYVCIGQKLTYQSMYTYKDFDLDFAEFKKNRILGIN